MTVGDRLPLTAARGDVGERKKRFTQNGQTYGDTVDAAGRPVLPSQGFAEGRGRLLLLLGGLPDILQIR